MSDYISREAALLEIEEWADTFCECDYVWPHVIESIKKLAAADVRPVVLGKWVGYQQGRWVYAKCSVCETVHDVRSNYCPNCGADMRDG